MSFIEENPEYEHILMTDEDVQEVVCRFALSDAVRDAFGWHKFGACKADLWRMVILHRYGGIYMDIDSQ